VSDIFPDGQEDVTLGGHLKSAREAKGLSLEDVALETRIGKNYIVAIEKNEFDKLPSPAYVKGFLRLYAGFLGLSGDEMVRWYEKTTLVPPDEHPLQKKRRRESRPRGLERKGRWAVTLFLLIVVALAAYFMESPGNSPQRHDIKPAVPVQSVQPPVQPRISSALPAPISSQADGTFKESTAVPPEKLQLGKGIFLRLKVNQDCWLNIDIDGEMSRQYYLKAGDLIEWKGDKYFALDVGNAGGVEVEFNGKPMKPLGEVGKPVHVVLKADGAE
jgi:transcriptional regulator with XRE-family HTH domain